MLLGSILLIIRTEHDAPAHRQAGQGLPVSTGIGPAHELTARYYQLMEWWKTIAPLVGVILGSLGTLLGQKLSDGRTLRRDRLLAHEEAKERLKSERVTIQREAVIGIQNALEGVMAANSQTGTPLSEQFRAVTTESMLYLNVHMARLEDRELASSVQEWLRSHHSIEAARTALEELQDRLSRHLRALYSD